MSDKKPKGAKSAYACFSQVYREEQRKESPENQLGFTEFSKSCSDKWKKISDKDKKRFMDIAAKDKERFLTEMENYEPVKSKNNYEPYKSKPNSRSGGNANGKNKRKAKDPNKPKAAWSAFFFFSDENRKIIKEKHPDYKIGDVAKVLGKMWAECKDKSKYEEMNRVAKEKYLKEMADYKNGGPPSKMVNRAAQDESEEEESEDDE